MESAIGKDTPFNQSKVQDSPYQEADSHVIEDFDYSDGPNSVPRTKQANMDIVYRKEKVRPQTEDLHGLLDYSNGEIVSIRESIGDEPPLTNELLREKLSELARLDNLKGHRALVNRQIVALGGVAGDLEKFKSYYIDLVANDPQTQKALTSIADVLCDRAERNAAVRKKAEARKKA